MGSTRAALPLLGWNWRTGQEQAVRPKPHQPGKIVKELTAAIAPCGPGLPPGLPSSSPADGLNRSVATPCGSPTPPSPATPNLKDLAHSTPAFPFSSSALSLFSARSGASGDFPSLASAFTVPVLFSSAFGLGYWDVSAGLLMTDCRRILIPSGVSICPPLSVSAQQFLATSAVKFRLPDAIL